MAEAAAAAPRLRALSLPSSLIRRLRLVSGSVLFAFVSCHFLNHALGLISLAAMERGLPYFQAVWLAPGRVWVLYTAFAVHFLLALWAIYNRRRLLHMPLAEAVQLLAGLSIVPMLALHVVSTRVAFQYFDVGVNYTLVLINLALFNPRGGAQQAAVLIVAWVHGCVGLWFSLRLKSWYPRVQPLLFALALLLPTFGLLGYAMGAKEVAALSADPDWLARALAAARAPDPETVAQIQGLQGVILAVFAALLGATLLARAARFQLERRRGRVRITYPGGTTVEIIPGMTVLEASHLNGIAHTAVCGGHGRCSTCRVRISRGLENLPPASAAETAVLARVAAPPNVRLACQLRPTGEVTLAPLVPAGAGAAAGWRQLRHLQGQEQEIAILFADLRGFTEISERKLPYDVVFVLNRYFAAMGRAIEEAGGRVDKFIGDGVMALFGVGEDAATGARNALRAARAMAISLGELNETLTHDLDRPLRLGIGIHAGPAIVGEMGYARAVSVTAIGDAVNTASRLEAMTKDFGAQLVISETVVAHSGRDLSAFPLREADVRGRTGRLQVRVVEHAAQLPV